MEPKGANIILTSLSEHFLEIIPTNNFLSSINKIWEKKNLISKDDWYNPRGQVLQYRSLA